jgi:gliding-associated putative ABC transporter substrate-binding component GldG
MKGKKNIFIEFAFVIVIVVLINLIFGQLMIRFDLTKNSRYTLSKSTKTILNDLNNDIYVEFYVSKNLPSYIINLKKEIWDVLNEYKIHSKNRIHIKEIDPSKNPDLARRLYMYGIKPVSINAYQKDRAEVISTYIGIAAFYKDKVESIPFIQDAGDLEYKFSSLVMKLTAKKIPIIGYPSVGSEINIAKESTLLLDSLGKQYKVIPVNLEKEDSLKNIDLLIVPNYKVNLSDKALYNLDQFIIKGGKTSFFVSGVNIDFQRESKVNHSNIIDFLKSKSITVNNDLVNDFSNNMIGFSAGQRQLIAPYPLFIKVLNKNMNPKFSFLKKIPSVDIGWVSSLFFSTSADCGFDIIMKSSVKAWLSKNYFNIDPTTIKPPKDKTFLGQFILAGIEYGKFSSYFKKESLPDDIDANDFQEKSTVSNKIFAIGTSHILRDDIQRRFPNTKIFILNFFDNLLLGDKLSNIRTKSIRDPSVKPLSDDIKALIKILNYIFMPIIVILFGLFRYLKRKRRGRAKVEAKNETV